MFDEFCLTHTHWIPLSSLYVGCDFSSPDMLSTLPPSAYPKFVVMSPTSPITVKNMGADGRGPSGRGRAKQAMQERMGARGQVVKSFSYPAFGQDSGPLHVQRL